MRGKDRTPPHLLHGLIARCVHAVEFYGKQGGMTLVHVKLLHIRCAKLLEHAGTAYAQYRLLHEPPLFSTRVEPIGKPPIFFLVSFHVGIKKNDWVHTPLHAIEFIEPRANAHFSPQECDKDFVWQSDQMFLRIPLFFFFKLPPGIVKTLAEISFPMKKRHANHRNIEICKTTKRVSREHAQSSRVGRHSVLNADLHAKICHSKWAHRNALNDHRLLGDDHL